jgi:hypothetical protein
MMKLTHRLLRLQAQELQLLDLQLWQQLVGQTHEAAMMMLAVALRDARRRRAWT